MPPSLDGDILIFDTETVDHNLTFGAAELYNKRKRKKRVVFYRDDLPETDPAGYEHLKSICTDLDVKLVPREWLFQYGIWPARKLGWVIVGANVVYDLSRIADSFAPATKGGRYGTRFCNGFAFKKRFVSPEGVVEPVFCRIKRDDRHHVRFDMRRAVVLDVLTLAGAHTDRNHALMDPAGVAPDQRTSACHAFGVPFEPRPGSHSGTINRENVEGCLYDVDRTAALLWALEREHSRHPIALHPAKAQTGAAIAKAYFDALGVKPRLEAQPAFDKRFLGYAAQGYFGGQVEARIIRTPLPCVYLDFLSMYVTVQTLLGLWSGHVTPALLAVEEIPPAEIEDLLSRVREAPEILFDPATWKTLGFFALVDPLGAQLPARVDVPRGFGANSEPFDLGSDDEARRASNSAVTVGPVESPNGPLWYAGPDLAAAALRGGKPQVVQAWRLRATHEQLDTLTPILFRGADAIDPRTEDFLARLIELRQKKTGDPLDEKRRKTGYKTVALSGAYGVLAETSPMDIDPEAMERKLRRVVVYAGTSYEAQVDRPEQHGRYCFFPTASLVTAGARLMLALGIHEVEKLGGDVAYVDTDSLAVVSSEDGGYIPCEYGRYVLPDGTRAVRALSWAEVETARAAFHRLNPYRDPTIVGDVLKLEDENFADPERTVQRQLWCFAVSEKSYALYNLADDGTPVIRKYSSLVLGQMRSPIPGDRRGQWILDAWAREISAALGLPVAPFPWEQHPAIAQLTISTCNALRPYKENAGLRPFDFLAVGMISRKLSEIAGNPYVCCAEPRPACALFSDPADWWAQDWRCLRCGKPWPRVAFPPLRTYGELVEATLQHVERKRLNADGSERMRASRGVTIPRPVCVESKRAIGKEVIVDPTDTDEGLTDEQLNATSVLVYRNSHEELNALRAEIKRVGVAPTARASKVSRSQVKAFVNQGATPDRSTASKLQTAVRRLSTARVGPDSTIGP